MKKYILLCLALVVAGCSNPVENTTPIVMGPEGPEREKHTPVADRPDPIDLTEPGTFKKGTCIPTIIDTRSFKNQIYRDGPFQGEQQSSSIFRPVKKDKPVVGPGPGNNLTAGNVSDRERIQHESLFPGITSSPWTPPDPALAAGPNHVIETVNMELAIFSKDGTKEFQQRLDSTGDPGFFEDIGGGTFTFDPKCFYDHNTQRYFIVALEVYFGDEEAWITIAVSDDDDPHGIWYKYRTWAVVEVGDATYWCDYPGLGFDSNGIYITNNLFLLAGSGGFGGVLYRAYDFEPLLNGDPVEFFDVRDGNAGSVQVAQCFGDNTAPLFVSLENSTQLRVQAMEDPFGTPSLTTALVDIPEANSPPGAANIGGTLSVVGSRIMNVHWRDGRLWAAHAVRNTPEPGEPATDRAVARWYEIEAGDWPVTGSADPVLRQSGDVDLGGENFTFFPAIYTDSFGHAVMVYGKSAPDEAPSVQAVGRHESDPLGEMGAPNEFLVGASGASGRWGDYFDICLDPTNNSTFWMVGEYQESDGWRTTINSFTVTGDPGFVAATDFNVVSGRVGGTSNIADLQASDDQYVVAKRLRAPNISIEFKGTSENVSPNSITFRIESRVSTADSVTQMIQLYNYATDTYDLINTVAASTSTDAVEVIVVNQDASQYVDTDTQEIKARVTYTGTSDQFRINAFVDYVYWTVSN